MKKQVIRPKAYIRFYTDNKLWGCNKTKGLRVGAVNCGTDTIKYMEKKIGGKGYFIRFVEVHFGINPQSLVIQMFFSSWYRKGTFRIGNLMTSFRGKREVRKPFMHLFLSAFTSK